MPDEASQIALQWGHEPTMTDDTRPNEMESTDNDDRHELAVQFGLDTDYYDPNDIPDVLVPVMEYIRDNTGLLGDYNDGLVHLGEGGAIIQWYGRGRYFSSHDDLLQWIQMEAEGVMLGVVGTRPHPDAPKEMRPYAEITPVTRWGYDDE